MSAQRGIRAFTEGFRLARNREIVPYIIVPAMISLVIIGAGTWIGFGYINAFGAYLTESLPGWLSFLEALLVPLLYLLSTLLGVWFFSLLAVIIASPFLGGLSSQVERNLWGQAPGAEGGWWRDLGAGLSREMRKLGYHLPRLLGVFVLTLIPLVNIAAPFIWLLFGAWTMAVQFCDYPGENRQEPFSATLQKLRDNRSAALGFGLCVALTLAIPLLNFVLIPVAVVGGTLLWRQLDSTTASAEGGSVGKPVGEPTRNDAR